MLIAYSQQDRASNTHFMIFFAIFEIAEVIIWFRELNKCKGNSIIEKSICYILRLERLYRSPGFIVFRIRFGNDPTS